MFPINDESTNTESKKFKKAREKQINNLLKFTSKLTSKMTKTPEEKSQAKKAIGELGKKLKDMTDRMNNKD